MRRDVLTMNKRLTRGRSNIKLRKKLNAAKQLQEEWEN